MERTKNATRNIIFGFLLKLYQIIMPFIMRTVMIYFLGIEYLGLNSLFTSILSVLNLAELGVGSAMVYSMYKPIAEKNEQEICALMSLYKTYYRIIGLIIAIIGLCITPFITNFIKSDLPSSLNVYIIYLMNLAATVLSYWLFAYKNSILQAHQRMDVISKVTLITNTIQYSLQIIAIVAFNNYYAFLIVLLISQVLTNICTAYFANQIYPKYKAKGNLGKSEIKIINKRIRDLFTSKVGGIVVNSADTIVISTFLGLTTLAIYQNYFFIITSIISIIGIVFQSVTAGIGNSIIVDSNKKILKDFRKFTFIIAWLAGFCSVCLLCLMQPFMEFWVGKNLELEFIAIVSFCIYFFVFEINTLLNTYKDAAGIWHEDRFRPLITAFANLILNLILVQFIGIYGVIFSTVISMLFIGMPWILYNLFTVLFKKEYLKLYVLKLFIYSFYTILVASLSYFICLLIPLNGMLLILARGFICCITVNLSYFVLYKNTVEFKDTLILLNNITYGKFKILERLI